MNNDQPLIPSSSTLAGTKTNTNSSKTALQRIKAIASGTIGNMVEYYDWYTYSAFSLYFAKVFFPVGSTTVQLLNVAAVFAVGFFMRPIGSWILGIYADRKGRRAALLVSVASMCVGSLVIGLSPGYQTIGIFAPILLVSARLLQGLSLGGEYASSATYLSEMAPPRSRGFYSSFLFATLSLGQLLALGVLVLLQKVISHADLAVWGWRVPFLLGAVSAAFAIYLRRNMVETDSFQKHQRNAQPARPLSTLIKHWRQCLVVAGLTLGGTVAFYAFTTYMQKYLVNTSGLPVETASVISAIAMICFVLIQPVFGALSDLVGRRALLLSFGVFGTLFTIPIFNRLAVVHDNFEAFILVLLALIITSLYSSVSAIAKAELFPVGIRALGVGLPYAITVSVFGGTAEYLGLWLKSIGHEQWFYWYVTACIFCTFLSLIFTKDSRKFSCIDQD